MSSGAATDISIIDQLGVQAVAEALSISPQAVNKWKQRGVIPQARRNQLRNLATANGLARATAVESNATSVVESVNRLPMVVPPGWPRSSARLVDAARISGSEARHLVDVAIAERAVELAGRDTLRAAERIADQPSKRPVRGYPWRLALLFVLDFPVLTMAFVAVARVSPLVATGSAVALSLFLVLGAHTVGGPLHALATRLPAIARAVIALGTLLAFLAAVIWVTLDLRIKGLALEASSGAGQSQTDLVFGTNEGSAGTSLSEPLQRAIARAAGLVTIGSTLFAIVWSYRQHGPEAEATRAEAVYRRSLRRLARMRRRQARQMKAVVIAVFLAAVANAMPTTVRAADCSGPVVLALIDTTTAYDEIDRAVMVPAIEAMAASLIPHQRLVIRTVRDTPASSRVLFDACVPGAAEPIWSLQGALAWLITNQSEVEARSTQFFTGVRQALLPQLEQTHDTPDTALVETLEHAVRTVDQIVAIWLYSDLLESSVVAPADLLMGDPETPTSAASPLPNLTGVVVNVAGIGRFHDDERRPLTAQEHRRLITAWSTFVQDAGATLQIHD